jgi:hypothetical protein
MNHEQAMSLVSTQLEPDIDNQEMIDVACARTCMHVHARVERNGKEGNGMEPKGTEEEGKRERNNTIVASETRRRSGSDPVQCIFEHWKTVMQHPNAKLDPKRQKLIRKALSSGYALEELCDAITGCSLTPHNMGDNERDQRYDGLHVILRDADQIDRFIRNCSQPPKPPCAADRHTQANVHVLQDWMQQKMQEEYLNVERH